MIADLRRFSNRTPETVQDLLSELGRAELKDSSEISADIVTMNSVVRLRDMDMDDVMELTLVYPDAADIETGKVSVLAPLGTAMLGYRTGDVFEWRVPAGVRKFKVEAVLFQPENATSGEAA